MEGISWFRRMAGSLGLGPSALQEDPNWPEWYRDYYVESATRPDRSTPLEHVPFVVIDAETTGLNVKDDHLLSIGGLRLSGNTIHVQDRFEAYLPSPKKLKDYESVAIHGIIPRSRRYTYSKEPDLLARLLKYLGSSVIIGHHIGFDLAVINGMLERAGAGTLNNRVIDTGKLAQRLKPSGYWTPPGEYNLDTLARQYRIPLSDRHTALGDSYITAVLFLKLAARYADRQGRALKLDDLV